MSHPPTERADSADRPVDYEVSDGIATVTLNRPDALNALTLRTKEALLAALHEAAGDPAVRAVLLTGAGRGFCVGQDLREHATALESGEGLDDTVRKHYNPIVTELAEMNKPTVAAVNGPAAGAGASLAFACDLRVAAEKASFLMAFAQVGLAPDSGASWTLQRLVGRTRALELLLLAEPVKAERALEMGLVHSVHPGEALTQAAGDLAARLANGPTVAYGAIKQAVNYAAEHGLAESLEREAELQEACGVTADHRSATAAFVNKQTPTFEGH